MTITQVTHHDGSAVVVVAHNGVRMELSITDWSKALATAKVIDERTPKS